MSFLSDMVKEVETLRAGTPPAGASSSPADAASVAATLESFKAQLGQMQQSLKGGGYKTVIGFVESFEWLCTWAETHLPKESSLSASWTS